MGGPSAQGWTEVRVDAPLGWAELVGEHLAAGPCTSVVFGTTSVAATPAPPGHEAVRAFVAAADDTPSLRRSIQAALAALAARAGEPELEGLIARFKELPPEDYATSWRKSWKPFRVDHLVLLPPWRAGAPPRADDVRLTLAPGGAFGSGRHATTRTVLRLLQRGWLLPGDRVLDAGCGSGVLAVAACLLGAKSALGFDVDPNAPREATLLAADNAVGARCEFRAGDFSALRSSDGGFDLALANIYADVLQAHAADVAARLRPGGRFLFSGCRADHVDATRPALAAAGLLVREEWPRGRWWTFAGERP